MFPSGRTTIAIAFHSGYGHAAVVAEAVARREPAPRWS